MYAKTKSLWKKEDAVTPVIGTTLLVGMTVTMVATVAVSVLGFALPENVPHAKIVIVEAKGDIGSTQLYKNFIVLRHKGGDALNENDTKIIVMGKGYTYTTGIDPEYPAQSLRVTYKDITGKNYYHNGTNLTSKKIVSGTSWDAGESIEFYGRDGINIGGANQGNTVDSKWKLQAGSTVSITILDITTNEVIAVSQATVKDA